MSAVFAWIETFNGSAILAAWESVIAGKHLADSYEVPLVAVVFGKNAEAIAQEASRYGATEAITCDDVTLDNFRLEPYAALLSKLIIRNPPKAVIAVGNRCARELLASVAADTNNGMLDGISEMDVTDGDSLSVKRTAHRGRIISRERIQSETAFLTVKPRIFHSYAPTIRTAINITPVDPVLSEDQINTKVESFSAEMEQPSLSDAEIIISGGRGMVANPADPPSDIDDLAIWKAQDGFQTVIQPVADTLNAAVGASRVAIDLGYIAVDHLVGQTGISVNSDVYIAVGISGARQHLQGLQNSKIIIAINNDANAPIFKVAKYGIVEDLYRFLPAFNLALKARLNK